MSEDYLLLPLGKLPQEQGWLDLQARPVIAWGDGASLQADVVVRSETAAGTLIDNIQKYPRASLALVQVLRAVEQLSVQSAITVESLAYATLQAGAEHQAWLDAREYEPGAVAGGDAAAVVLERTGGMVSAQLNRPNNRNSLTVEMRDALVETLELLRDDTDIIRLELSGKGDCFCVGGELREFGLTPGVDQAHCIRSVHNPSRLMADLGARVHCYLHGACIGSGIELPAFAHQVVAQRKTFFQLPELRLGLIPGAGGCVSISRRIGRQRTAWLVLSGRKINSSTALDWGLIDAVVD